ncbi:short-chain dehydrogenase/reductase SDR family protein (plasmid) [Rhizobium etli]|uniref:Short-chain dehydrogenase/reductase SDR family protein n=1 Tax=Rhizobium etli TaxID=29449 RepID=A0AAN1BNF5_RHIET|nr:SDR family NAD(P)-dependent oxidoreductase [Rhizobium etli]ARQ14445.1 short-chain dehydrogenase/reductase SDR family protein [Rhizobium etli]
MRFKNKTALITGGGTGIGAAVARRIRQEGGNVGLVGRRPEPLRAVAEEIGATVVAADAADSAAMKASVEKLVETFGGLDVLIANAGGHGIGPTLSMSDETWDLAVRLNLNTAFVSARESLPHLIKSRGNIVVLASIAGLFAGPDAAGYVTMKHGCIGLAKSLARDYGRKGVRTNTVCPGWVTTAMADEQMEFIFEKYKLNSIEEAYALVTKDVPLGRPATAEDVANAVCFLASGEASMINGAVLTVDGGAGTVDLPTLAFVE